MIFQVIKPRVIETKDVKGKSFFYSHLHTQKNLTAHNWQKLKSTFPGKKKIIPATEPVEQKGLV